MGPPASQDSSCLRLSSWNLDSIRARYQLLLAWLDQQQPDVVCLQETKVSARAFPRAGLEERGYEIACSDASGHGGVAVLSRVGLDDPIVGIPGAKPPLNEQRSISATCGGLRVHSVYAPNGRKVGTRYHQTKLAWLSLFAAWVGIDGLDDGNAVVVLGDLNVAPSDLDVWDASRYRKRNLTSPDERAAFQKLLDVGLVDVVRSCYGDEIVYTWWNRRGDFFESDRGWRLDHCLADPTTAAAVNAVVVDRSQRGLVGASDHAPLIVDVTA